jgi:hypothetical protein
MWNSHGFRVIDRLPTSRKINSVDYISNILQLLNHAFFPWKTTGGACVQLLNSQECDGRIVHENSGHDFHTTSTIFAGPSDFYFFATIKERVEHVGITNDEELFEELHMILRAIPREELESVLEIWLERVRSVSQGEAGYIDQ